LHVNVEIAMLRPAFLLLLPLPLAACSIDPSPNAPEAKTLTVAAAASLTDVFTDIEATFEAQHPDIDIQLNFAASGTLQRQIEQNAPIDLFASAGEKPMDELTDRGLIDAETRQVFARNRIVVVVPRERSIDLEDLDQLNEMEIDRIAIGNPETVPAGRYAKQALEAANVYRELEDDRRFVFAENVRQVLAYVEQNSVDLAIVYQTDAATSDLVRPVFPIPPELSEPIRYPIAVIAGSQKSDAALQFIDFATGPEGRAILEQYGFLGTRQ